MCNLDSMQTTEFEIVTVEDRAGLDALPIGTRYVDVEGDTITKHSDGQWYVEGGEWAWGVALLEEFLPGIVLNLR